MRNAGPPALPVPPSPAAPRARLCCAHKGAQAGLPAWNEVPRQHRLHFCTRRMEMMRMCSCPSRGSAGLSPSCSCAHLILLLLLLCSRDCSSCSRPGDTARCPVPGATLPACTHRAAQHSHGDLCPFNFSFSPSAGK